MKKLLQGEKLEKRARELGVDIQGEPRTQSSSGREITSFSVESGMRSVQCGSQDCGFWRSSRPLHQCSAPQRLSSPFYVSVKPYLPILISQNDLYNRQSDRVAQLSKIERLMLQSLKSHLLTFNVIRYIL
jgi:hypothetical protein